MEVESSVIETGVDKLVNLVKERGRIALADAAKELGVSTTVAQEWVDFLEEEGIISVEYKLTKPYLVERKLTKKEIDVKAKEFTSKKDVFVRKAEVSLSFLGKQADELKKVKKEFDIMKSELGMELDTVREDLKELERYQQLKEELQKQVEEQKSDAKQKIEELTKQVLREQNRYRELITDLKKEKETLSKEKAEAQSIEESEKILNQRLSELKGIIGQIEKRVVDEDEAIKNSEVHIEKLNTLIDDIKQRVEEEKAVIDPLIDKSKEQEKKVLELQERIVQKISQKQKKVSNVKNVTKKVEDFFRKKLAVVNLVDRVNKDRDELEKSLIELIRKAKSFQLSASKGDVGKEMIDLEKKFDEVDKKKSQFESELKEFGSVFKR
jgi:chromosome segregation ATPase